MFKGREKVLVLAIFIAFMASLSSVAFSTISFVSGPAAISTGHYEETSTVVVDEEGFAHIVWASDYGTFLFYKMVDMDGTVLIDETNLNPCAFPDTYHVRRPSIELDPSGALHIVFHGWSLYSDLGATEYATITFPNASEVIYTKINPYDYLDAGASDINDLIVIPETIISTDDGIKSRAPNVALDPSNSMLHVVWYDDNPPGPSINYLVLDLDGNAITAETSLTSGLVASPSWGEPEIALDPDGNAHIVYCPLLPPHGPDDREIFYTMVTVISGFAITLIDDTEITMVDGNGSVKPHLAVDSEGMVHVVWHDRKLLNAGTGEHEIFYSKLDPSQDDQNGDSADPLQISVISEVQISSNNLKKSHAKNITVDERDRIHVVWLDEGLDEADREVYYALFDSSGNILTPVEPETVIMTGQPGIMPIFYLESSGYHPEIATYCDRVYITFNVLDTINWYVDIYLTILSVPTIPAVPSGVSASDGVYTDRIEVSWDIVACTEGYIVNRSTSASDYGNQIGDTTNTSFTDNDPTLVADRTYYYWVRSYTWYGPSDYSDPDTGYVRAVSEDGGEDGGGGGCLMAKAASSSPLQPYMATLRVFRDEYLMPNRVGRTLVHLYYRNSPYIAGFMERYIILKVGIRMYLPPLIAFSYSMVHFGPIVTAFVIVFMLVFPTFLILLWRMRKKRVEA